MNAWWNLPEDEWEAAIDAEMRQRSRALAALRAEIGRCLARGEPFVIANSFPRHGRTLVHPSSKGVRWQVTWWDDDGPVGDTAPQTLTHAAQRVWEDLTQETREQWIEKSQARGTATPQPGVTAIGS